MRCQLTSPQTRFYECRYNMPILTSLEVMHAISPAPSTVGATDPKSYMTRPRILVQRPHTGCCAAG